MSPDEWARAEQRRARNALTYSWWTDPRLPGRTIDLGPFEVDFIAAAQAEGVDVGALYPALVDWLRWRWQRHQKDRPNATLWQRTVRVDLARRKTAADVAVRWQALGGLDRRTKAGKAVAAALRTAGYEAAARVAAHMLADLAEAEVAPCPAVGDRSDGLPLPEVRPWAARRDGEGWKRRLPDRPKASENGNAVGAMPRGPGRPKQLGRTQEEVAALSAVLFAASPEVRAMFAAIPLRDDQLRFLQDLQRVHSAPNDAGARACWMAWVTALHGQAEPS